jgi:hypothetical protein
VAYDLTGLRRVEPE